MGGKEEEEKSWVGKAGREQGLGPLDLGDDEVETILHEARELAPEINVGDHIHSAGIVLLVLDAHADSNVEERRAEEDNAENASNGETSSGRLPRVASTTGCGAGILGLPHERVDATIVWDEKNMATCPAEKITTSNRSYSSLV